jgi:hypothetical protein
MGSTLTPDLSVETADYIVSYRYSHRHRAHVVAVRSRSQGGHSAEHARFTLIDDEGALLDTPPIDERVARFILRHFDVRGDTESFTIYRSDLEADRLLTRAAPTVEPGDVVHTLTTTEQSFTATGAKLAAHWPIFEKHRDTGYGSIIRATMTLHQVCSSRCHYCSTIARNRRDSISLPEAQAFVEALLDRQAAFNRERFPAYNARYRALTGADIRLRGLILSGGGQPNLWPHFTPFVEWLAARDIDLGLITNGFPRSVPDDVYRHFKWVRISVTPEDASPHYVDGQFNKQYLPPTLRFSQATTVGYSYVVGAWTDDDILRRIDASMDEHGFAYCRLLTDCNLTRSSQLLAHRTLAEQLLRLGYVDASGRPLKRFFHQLKYHGTADQAPALWDEGQCQLQIYNVFWDTTGHDTNGRSSCYACDSITVLSEEGGDRGGLQVIPSQRRFDYDKWGTVSNDQVERLYTEPVRAFFDPRQVCSACLFMRNNETVKLLRRRADYSDIRVDPDLDHVNFP